MTRDLLPPDLESSVFHSLNSTSRVSGFTHNFYRYPARMSPQFARAAIAQYSQPGEVVLDPFSGGGTTLVEALASGRQSVGVDINPLATFVTKAKTTPLSKQDASVVRRWAEAVSLVDVTPTRIKSNSNCATDARIRNMPTSLVTLFEHVLELPFPRQRQFARCALLRLGQWAVDGKSIVPETQQVQNELQRIVKDMLTGLDGLVWAAAASGLEKRRITGRRSIMLRSAIGLEDELNLTSGGRPKLVLTSPPYPAVHVLYHRWQVNGRRETPAPYWLIDTPDGHGASYFTMGGRSQFGVNNYFRSLTAAFRSVRSIIDPDGVVLQLVSFSNAERQLPAFLQAMENSGFQEDAASAADRTEWWRTVPNRNWYYRVDATRNAAQEVLLVHRPDRELAKV